MVGKLWYCLGMQIYINRGEAKQVKGLGIIKEKSKKLLVIIKFKLLCPTLDGIGFN